MTEIKVSVLFQRATSDLTFVLLPQKVQSQVNIHAVALLIGSGAFNVVRQRLFEVLSSLETLKS